MLVVKSGPFGDKLIGSKCHSYNMFKEIMELFIKKEHMSKEGMLKIAKIIYSSSLLKNRVLTYEEFIKKHNLNDD